MVMYTDMMSVLEGSVISVTLGCDTGFTNLGHGCGKYPVKVQCQSNATHVFWTIDHLHCVGGTSTND